MGYRQFGYGWVWGGEGGSIRVKNARINPPGLMVGQGDHSASKVKTTKRGRKPTMFYCSKCGILREFEHTDYYGFDHYVCPECGHDMAFPRYAYNEPNSDGIAGYFDELDEDDNILLADDLETRSYDDIEIDW